MTKRVVYHLDHHIHPWPPSISSNSLRISASSSRDAFFTESACITNLRADPAKNAALMAQTPLKRWGQPQEIAALALYICSDAAAFMTGNDVLIDGGWCAQ
jgi:NAD(P)-dependent dehydrogenase (short-subunit alcohol dehydrogenase family)